MQPGRRFGEQAIARGEMFVRTERFQVNGAHRRSRSRISPAWRIDEYAGGRGVSGRKKPGRSGCGDNGGPDSRRQETPPRACVAGELEELELAVSYDQGLRSHAGAE